ncbi:hypothetical protein EUTSA_v10019513mg, partial [Eutrema salsugineum]
RRGNHEQRKKKNSEGINQSIGKGNRFREMAEKKDSVPPEYDVNAKWDACLDLTTRRFVYSSLGGAFAGSPATRWASIAFGAGIGIGSAYTDCSRSFDAPSSSSANLAAPKSTETSVSQCCGFSYSKNKCMLVCVEVIATSSSNFELRYGGVENNGKAESKINKSSTSKRS